MTSPIENLLQLMRCLRSAEFGCPWDKRQTFSSITAYTIEEVYEVVEAIDQQDFPHLREELGDLLFQIVFYCQMAQEQGEFDFTDVITTLMEKMLRRHPHVFPSGELASFGSAVAVSEVQIKQQWETIKAQEKALKIHTAAGEANHPLNNGILDDVPRRLPPLLQAVKLQKKASTVGFDWQEVAPVMAKIREELDELEEALQAQDTAHMKEEFGDLLFAMANLGRHLELDPERALTGTNEKFRRRFAFIEQQVKQAKKTLTECSLDELDSHWDAAKRVGL